MTNPNEAPPAKIEVPINEDLSGSVHDISDMMDDLVDAPDPSEPDPLPVPEPVADIPIVEEVPKVPETPTEETPIVEDPPSEDPPLSVEDDLRAQLAHMSSVFTAHGINPADIVPNAQANIVAEPAPEAAKPDTNAPAPLQVDLTPLTLSQEEFDAVFEKPEAFIGLLNTVRESAVEQVLRSVPQLAAQIVNQQTVLQGIVQDFYSTNKDLAGMKPFVAVVANEIAAKNPGWSVDQVFSEAATESRKRLHIKAAADNVPAKTRKPGLPGKATKKAPASKPSLSSLEQELNDLM